MKDLSGNLIRQLRARLDMSQEQMAAKIGVAFSTLNRWENDKSSPRGKARRRLLEIIEEVGFEENQNRETSSPRRRLKNDVF